MPCGIFFIRIAISPQGQFTQWMPPWGHNLKSIMNAFSVHYFLSNDLGWRFADSRFGLLIPLGLGQKIPSLFRNVNQVDRVWSPYVLFWYKQIGTSFLYHDNSCQIDITRLTIKCYCKFILNPIHQQKKKSKISSWTICLIKN